MSRASTFKDIKDTINLFNERFQKNVGTRQRDMWSQVFKAIKNLETDDQGNILSNTKNLRLLRTIRGDIKNTILTAEYKADVGKFLTGFDELKDINDLYYKTIASTQLSANAQVFIEIKNAAVEATKNSLLDSGITENLIKPVENVLSQNVTTGGSFQDLTDVLRKDILGDTSTLGRLERYSKQITTDSLNQFNANYNQAVSQKLELEFYFYNGAVKETSRQYCKDNVAKGRYFHKKEIEDQASGNWAGQIPGTNSSNIFTYRGGYNCGHQWLAVDTIAVPKEARDRAEALGYFKP